MTALDPAGLLEQVQKELDGIRAKKEAEAAMNRPWTKQVSEDRNQSGLF